MSTLEDMRRVERWMTYVRWFGVLFGVVSTALQPNYPTEDVQVTVGVLIIALGLGNLAVRYALHRAGTTSDLARLGAIAFAFDIVAIMSLVWVFAFERPYVTWALLFVLPMEGALRYRLRGAIGAAVLVALFFVPQSFRVADLRGREFDLPTYVFVVGVSGLVAGVAGAMATGWHDKSLAFARQSKRLEELDRLKDRFLGITSHEIRGPVTAIITGVDTIRKRGARLTAEQRERLLEMISLQGGHLSRLVDDLLIPTQLQSGRLTLRVEWADLEQTIEQALSAAESKRRSHQVDVDVEPVQCEIDPARIAQIVRNLVENAYKYTPEGTPVTLSAKTSTRGLVLEVADAGGGIPDDRRGGLFDAFTRVEETAAAREGVGLGLYVVSQLVAAMDGMVELDSSPEGTTFTIQIPCAAMPADRAGVDPLPTEETPAPRYPRSLT